MLGHVAHALKRGAHAQRADDDPEVAGNRLLPGQNLDRELVEGDGALVDVAVIRDDLFCERDIACTEGTGGLVDGDRDEICDLGETDLDVLQ